MKQAKLVHLLFVPSCMGTLYYHNDTKRDLVRNNCLTTGDPSNKWHF